MAQSPYLSHPRELNPDIVEVYLVIRSLFLKTPFQKKGECSMKLSLNWENKILHVRSHFQALTFVTHLSLHLFQVEKLEAESGSSTSHVNGPQLCPPPLRTAVIESRKLGHSWRTDFYFPYFWLLHSPQDQDTGEFHLWFFVAMSSRWQEICVLTWWSCKDQTHQQKLLESRWVHPPVHFSWCKHLLHWLLSP